MNIHQLLPLLTPQPKVKYSNIIYALEQLYSDNNHSLDINEDLLNNHIEFKNIELYRLHHWSVDDHEGGIEVYTYKGIPFGSWHSQHEDVQNYDVLDYKIFKQVLNILLECLEPKDEEIEEKYENKSSMIFMENFPLLQFFDASYQVQGKHLLYLQDDNSYLLIDSYTRDTKNDYFSHYFNIIINGIESKVHYRRLLAVVNDNLEIAKSIVNKEIDVGNLLFIHNSTYNLE